MCTNLVIGKTAQLSNYFPSNFSKISARNIPFEHFKEEKLNTVYILFAEQRTFLQERESFFTDINVDYTLKVIDFFKERSKRVVVYSTAELWNNYEGAVSVEMPYNYVYSPYVKSKEILCNFLNEHRHSYQNVRIVYPFNFNSPWRKNGFLFAKIFNSILTLSPTTIGDINFYRDLIHP
jgi:nucleoside-diphosphate-sugar epimerase